MNNIYTKTPAFLFTLFFLSICLAACNNNNSSSEKNNKTAANAEANAGLQQSLQFALQHSGKIDDSIQLQLPIIVNDFYTAAGYANAWSQKGKWQPLADSLYNYIQHAELNGLFPNDYHYQQLHSLKAVLDDTLKKPDETLWVKADLMLTDGFMHILKDLKDGRLSTDSISLNAGSGLPGNFSVEYLNQVLSQKQLTILLNAIEPKHKGYWDLKAGIKKFIDSMDRHVYTYVTYPYKAKDTKDSLAFIKTFQRRLSESNCISFTNQLPDSIQLNTAVKNYQKLKGLKQDGIISSSIIKQMNTSDVEKFKRIAITLDRYKQLPAKMPEKYIWVNLPAYYLQVWDHDTLALYSKVICGKPSTPTPLLNSYITDMVTYPTWTVPTSIIVKQYLPKLKNNPNYISRLGLKLVNGKGETISPSSVSWGKYSKGIPYKIMQNSGDNNALGIFKFNFDNDYAVYLHDTNQRYLFKNETRDLSHGCVRVQEWDKLAYYIAANDSINSKPSDSLKYNVDSIKNWIAEKKHKRIDVKNKVALYIRYFTCEGKDGTIKFYDDIYGEDKVMREKYFSNK